MKFAALAIVGVAAYEQEWAEFQAAQGPRNGDIPEAFKKNVDAVKAHNAESDFKLSYTGPFADKTSEEYKQVLGYRPSSLYGDLPKVAEPEFIGELAESLDWTTKGAVTPVKNQGQCGSCWAFSTTGGLEGSWQLSSGNLISLSEQQLVDCSKDNLGCNGGLMDKGFQFLEGVDTCTEESYAYTARDGHCKTECTTAIPKGGVTGFVDVSDGEEGLLKALNLQPISVAIEADQLAFQLYHHGVLTGRCGQRLDHGVLAVGYGTDNGKDYWKVKNSWGPSWGEEGYIRIERGSNKCGISNQPSYPTVQSSVSV